MSMPVFTLCPITLWDFIIPHRNDIHPRPIRQREGDEVFRGGAKMCPQRGGKSTLNGGSVQQVRTYDDPPGEITCRSLKILGSGRFF